MPGFNAFREASKFSPALQSELRTGQVFLLFWATLSALMGGALMGFLVKSRDLIFLKKYLYSRYAIYNCHK
jgi:hypothetical protein